MYPLGVDEATKAVRKNLDELDINESVMMVPSGNDNASLDDVIARTLPEAINAVHGSASAAMLEGISGTTTMGVYTVEDEPRVIKIHIPASVLRLVLFQTTDTPHIVTEVTPEDSVEGRKQLNPSLRGTYDRPRLVQLQGKHNEPDFLYYSLKEDLAQGQNPASLVSRLDYIPEYKYAAATTQYNISTALRERILNHLTGLVLAIYGEADKAQYFLNKA